MNEEKLAEIETRAEAATKEDVLDLVAEVRRLDAWNEELRLRRSSVGSKYSICAPCSSGWSGSKMIRT